MDVKVSENCLSQPCSDDHLLTLSLVIREEVAPFLRLSAAEEEEIACDHPTSKSRKIAMLRKWRQKFGRNATYGSLAAVFRKLSRSDLAEAVEALAGGCDLPVAAAFSPLSVKFDLDSSPNTKKNVLGELSRSNLTERGENAAATGRSQPPARASTVSAKSDLESSLNTAASNPYVALLQNCCRHFPSMVVFIFVLGLAVLLSHAITCTCGCAGTTDSESESELVKVQ